MPKKLHKWKPPPRARSAIRLILMYLTEPKKKDHVDRDSLQEITMGIHGRRMWPLGARHKPCKGWLNWE